MTDNVMTTPAVTQPIPFGAAGPGQMPASNTSLANALLFGYNGIPAPNQVSANAPSGKSAGGRGLDRLVAHFPSRFSFLTRHGYLPTGIQSPGMGNG